MKSYAKIVALLLIPLIIVFVYSIVPWTFPTEEMALEKADFSQLTDSWKTDTLMVDSVQSDVAFAEEEEVVLDTARQRILFFGDSMLEGLSRRMCDYAMENGHELTSVCWYSSTSEIWSQSDTLQHFMRESKPTFVMICLCSNEQFVRDMSKRAKYIDDILNKIGDLPYIWICPPSWKQDTGIDSLIEVKVGKRRFFDSRRLTFQRGKDHVHPTFSSAEVWMDSVAVWMQSMDTQHPIMMNVPTEKRTRKWNQKMLQPLK